MGCSCFGEVDLARLCVGFDSQPITAPGAVVPEKIKTRLPRTTGVLRWRHQLAARDTPQQFSRLQIETNTLTSEEDYLGVVTDLEPHPDE